jgi:hypothetical protein
MKKGFDLRFAIFPFSLWEKGMEGKRLKEI